MNPKNISLNEISQPQQNKYCVIPFTQEPIKQKRERRIEVTRGHGERNRELLMRTEFLFGMLKYVLELDSCNGCTTS